MGLEGVDWVHLDQDRGHWNDFVNTEMNVGLHKARGFLD